jgi:transposase InsO family protein
VARSGGAAGVEEKLLQQDFLPPAPNRCWAGDITYVRTTAGWRYLAVWIDLYSRRVVGWTLDSRKHAISCSMSAKGHWWDNEVVESFFSTLKLGLGLDDDRDLLITPQQLQRDLAFWIEGYYNRERRHSPIGYLSPIDYEQRFIAARTLTTVTP